jgi:exosortase/archaeosortase family protein
MGRPLNSVRRAVVPLATATAVIVGAYVLLYVLLPSLGLDILHSLNLQLAHGASTLLQAFGERVTRTDHVLTLAGASVIVNNDCNSVGLWLLVTGAIFAMPAATLAARLTGSVGIAVVLSAINMVRIAQLTYVNAYRPAWFSTVHEQIDPVILIVISVGLFLAWARIAERQPHS